MSSPSQRLVAVPLLLLLTGACAPALEGPQLKKPPEGFGFDVNCSAARLMLPRDRERGQRCYFKLSDSPEGGVITRFEGWTSDAALRSSLEAYIARWDGKGNSRFGAPIPLRIDGRQALGVFEETPTRLALRALVPYDDETYSVEFSGRTARLKDRDALLGIVGSFSRDPGRASRILMPFALLAGLVGAIALIVRLRAGAERTGAPVVANITVEPPAGTGPAPR